MKVFLTNETAEPNIDLIFKNMHDSSNDDDNKFTLEFLDLILKKRKDDL